MPPPNPSRVKHLPHDALADHEALSRRGDSHALVVIDVAILGHCRRGWDAWKGYSEPRQSTPSSASHQNPYPTTHPPSHALSPTRIEQPLPLRALKGLRRQPRGGRRQRRQVHLPQRQRPAISVAQHRVGLRLVRDDHARRLEERLCLWWMWGPMICEC